MRTSSTCKSITKERSGFRGANGIGGKPGIGVRDSMNSGETCKDPTPRDGVRAERGNNKGGGVVGARGH
jgi:hypothetical protein